jgi:hypothetical protein
MLVTLCYYCRNGWALLLAAAVAVVIGASLAWFVQLTGTCSHHRDRFVPSLGHPVAEELGRLAVDRQLGFQFGDSLAAATSSALETEGT